MELRRYVVEIAERLAPANRPGFADIFVALLRELAKGRPVSPITLAVALDWPAEHVDAVLETLRETAHALEIDGRRLYTWCALDTLIFPSLIGQTTQVYSRCAATGAPISLTVTPSEIRDVEPAGVVVSLILPQAATGIRRSFCCHVHFFASLAVARDWVSKHAGVEIVNVQDAFGLGCELARYLSRATQ